MRHREERSEKRERNNRNSGDTFVLHPGHDFHLLLEVGRDLRGLVSQCADTASSKTDTLDCMTSSRDAGTIHLANRTARRSTSSSSFSSLSNFIFFTATVLPRHWTCAEAGQPPCRRTRTHTRACGHLVDVGECALGDGLVQQRGELGVVDLPVLGHGLAVQEDRQPRLAALQVPRVLPSS